MFSSRWTPDVSYRVSWEIYLFNHLGIPALAIILFIPKNSVLNQEVSYLGSREEAADWTVWFQLWRDGIKGLLQLEIRQLILPQTVKITNEDFIRCTLGL